MENPTNDTDVSDEYAELHSQIRVLLEKTTVEYTLAWLASMYGMPEAIAVFKTFRQVEQRLHAQSNTSL